jgi:UDP-N-acetylglucosamine--N-acetylmuramyl-(pentapeptide) pyrophosphoryl-undecaprenol N-acetylglucosamine transferase
VAVGLDPARPVLLVMGGSQGAGGINDLVIRMLPLLARQVPELQLLHLAGRQDLGKVEEACRALKLKAVVHPFFHAMELALGAATVAISRAGGSSLAELAAMRVPSVLIPFPAAVENHQFHNARAFEQTGAACLLEQHSATPETLTRLVLDLMANGTVRENMQTALGRWQAPKAASQVAEEILRDTGIALGESQDDDELQAEDCPPACAAKPGSLSHA